MPGFPRAYDPNWGGYIIVRRDINLVNLKTTARLDFRNYDPSNQFPEITFWFAHAFREWAVGRMSSTQHERTGALRHFFSFLRERTQCQRLRDVDSHILDELEDWIRSKSWGIVLQRRVFTFPLQLLRIIAAARPGVARNDINIRRFSSKGSERHPNLRPRKHILSKNDIRSILNECKAAIKKQREIRLAVSRDMDQAAASGYVPDSRPDPQNRGEVLLWTKFHFDQGDITDPRITGWIRYNVLRKRRVGITNTCDLYRLLYPIDDDLIPYYVLIALFLCINPSSLLSITINCLQPPNHVAADSSAVAKLAGREHVVWVKNRACLVQQRSFAIGNDFHPPHLIRELISITAPLRAALKDYAKDRLFVYNARSRMALWLRNDAFYGAFNRFKREHRLPSFRIRDLRPTGLKYAYDLSGGDLWSVSKLANHKSVTTTYDDYLAGAARDTNDTLLAQIVVDMTKWLRGKDERRHPVYEIRDDGPGPTLVRVWLSVLTNPRAVIFGNTERAARIIQLYDALTSAQPTLHPVRWQKYYFGLYRALRDEVLPVIADPIMQRARAIVPLLPHLPPIE